MNKAVFLDRDGTIIKECNYLSDPKKIKILPWVVKGIKLLNETGFKVVVITNQSGIARGFFDIRTLNKIHGTMLKSLKRSGATIDALYFCPHLPGGVIKKYNVKCRCRKPDIKMALQAGKDLNIDLKNSYMIGDKDIDIQFGENFGSKGNILVRTGYGHTMGRKTSPDHVASNFMKAVEWILKKERSRAK